MIRQCNGKGDEVVDLAKTNLFMWLCSFMLMTTIEKLFSTFTIPKVVGLFHPKFLYC